VDRLSAVYLGGNETESIGVIDAGPSAPNGGDPGGSLDSTDGATSW
jgi:hypothetical protein